MLKHKTRRRQMPLNSASRSTTSIGVLGGGATAAEEGDPAISVISKKRKRKQQRKRKKQKRKTDQEREKRDMRQQYPEPRPCKLVRSVARRGIASSGRGRYLPMNASARAGNSIITIKTETKKQIYAWLVTSCEFQGLIVILSVSRFALAPHPHAPPPPSASCLPACLSVSFSLARSCCTSVCACLSVCLLSVSFLRPPFHFSLSCGRLSPCTIASAHLGLGDEKIHRDGQSHVAQQPTPWATRCGINA